jgi:hypothetical protein
MYDDAMHVNVDQYGMTYNASNAEVIAEARTLPDSVWEALPVMMIPHGTTLHANEQTLIRRHIDKVVSGAEPLRPGYVTRLYRTNDELHIVDGHHRAAMYWALGRDMPAQIATDIKR